ncbi:hypothetical protein BDW02DRAFT_116889 [Decorospora gaudefroyi]|uniref:RING-type domain-containing protein n=1 Tax=Decorospora gaudefroyi TaxID=184978 RepID=A0A6A5JZU5_9PLEO|nr:hypothetical protein BDW02DRAFT_116889 [Decorospora gaudefroyi]
MASTTILYEDFVNCILAIAPNTDTPGEPSCHICGREYGTAGPGPEAHLDYLSQLPGAFKKIFIEKSVDAVRTPCGHTFCTFCLGVWCVGKDHGTCPICRAPIRFPSSSDGDNTDDGMPDAGVEGLSLTLNLSTPTAATIYEILNMQVRQLLTTTTQMPFVWNASAMLHDLPKIMVTVARRIYYQGLRPRVGVPKDLSYMKLHNPMNRMIDPSSTTHDLGFFQRPDAPLVKHSDAQKLYEVLCIRIRDIEDVHDRCANWEGLARTLLYKLGNEVMPRANGGVDSAKWWAYVWCVVKALLVWQAYCERAHTLSFTARQASLMRAQELETEFEEDDQPIRTLTLE